MCHASKYHIVPHQRVKLPCVYLKKKKRKKKMEESRYWGTRRDRRESELAVRKRESERAGHRVEH